MAGSRFATAPSTQSGNGPSMSPSSFSLALGEHQHSQPHHMSSSASKAAGLVQQPPQPMPFFTSNSHFGMSSPAMRTPVSQEQSAYSAAAAPTNFFVPAPASGNSEPFGSSGGAGPVPGSAARLGSSVKGKGKADDDDDMRSMTSTSSLDKKKGKPPKKPAAAKGENGSASKEKKKKAGRACAACQKAHLTCDDNRPCARCVKRGCADTCQDGARKKAKYLQEIPDELLQGRSSAPVGGSVEPEMSIPPQEAVVEPKTEDMADVSAAFTSAFGDTSADVQNTGMATSSGPTFNFDTPMFFDQSAFANEFGSETANLEYAILSSMLNGSGFSMADPYSTLSAPTNGASQAGSSSGMLLGSPLLGPTLDSTIDLGGAQIPAKSRSTETMSPSRLLGADVDPNAMFGQPASNGGSSKPRSEAPPSGEMRAEELPATGGSSNSVAPQASSTQQVARKFTTAEEVYNTATKPYPYAQSYHYLVKHLKQRFEKDDILRIIRALATFRPSLIALQMPLTEEDEIFVERTFQRTLVELNKLISFSGTPTVVWRRTGEICVVGTEFCLLTGWDREELVGKKYIFELLDQSSVVEYYESFAAHAFESTSPSVTSQCVLHGPNGRPVPCAFCFSVRRDLFSLPFIVIGSFLPLLEP